MTASQLRGFAERIAAAVHVPRRAVDSATGELAILIGELCDSPEQAETLTATLTAQSWGKFDLAEVRRRIGVITGKGPASEQAPAPDSFDPQGPFTRREFDFLRDFARKKKLPTTYAAHEVCQDAARAILDKLSPRSREAFLAFCRIQRQRALDAYASLRSKDQDRYGSPKPYEGPTVPTDDEVREFAVTRLYREMTGELDRFEIAPLPRWLADHDTSVQKPHELGKVPSEGTI